MHPIVAVGNLIIESIAFKKVKGFVLPIFTCRHFKTFVHIFSGELQGGQRCKRQ